jgi:hypothetical protein
MEYFKLWKMQMGDRDREAVEEEGEGAQDDRGYFARFPSPPPIWTGW